jgi:hypothetical protein
MSRGLGKLQREIIETLDDAKRYFADPATAVEKQFMGYTFKSWPSYKGGSPFFRDGDPRQEQAGWVTHGRGFRIADNVYDLRASCRFLMKQRDLDPNRDHTWVFSIAFSRAVRSLVQRGLLCHLKHIVPIVSADDHRPPYFEKLADGDYVNVSGRQVRFVTRKIGKDS